MSDAWLSADLPPEKRGNYPVWTMRGWSVAHYNPPTDAWFDYLTRQWTHPLYYQLGLEPPEEWAEQQRKTTAGLEAFLKRMESKR